MDWKLGGVVVACLMVAACGGLQKKAAMVNTGDDKPAVIAALGDPQDTQMQGRAEAWQYCQTGAGFGYHDYRVIWFLDGRVVGVNSYKDDTPGRSCKAALREVRWDSAPDAILGIRRR